MNTKPNIHKLLLVTLLLLLGLNVKAQNIAVYKIDQLLNRIHNNSDTVYVVNFWATWCKPCIAELPDFERLHQEYKNQKVKVLLVSMDFKEDMAKKLQPFLQKKTYTAEVVLLDEVNGNDFINKVSESWSGAIPATLITRKNKSKLSFFEKKMTFELLSEQIR